MSEYILRMEKITKVYGNSIIANKNIDFTLREGEIHALVGENGAGKTTLMKILFGIEKASSGHIYLRNKELILNNSKDAIQNGIGMVHQHFMLVNSFTVAQNITLGIEPKKGLFVDHDKAVLFTRELSEQYNLPINPNDVVKTLPVGIKQKIEILKALARGAKILILDEPTAVLTPQETDQLFEELIHLKEKGYTIVFISHKIREVKKISDRITVMRAGNLEGVFNTCDITEQEISNKIVGWEVNTILQKSIAKTRDTRIQVKHLTYHGTSKVPLLDDINFSVRGGTILGIAGVQGNGQVELVELLTKARSIEKGSIQINNKMVNEHTLKQLRDSGFGYIPEDRMIQGIAKGATISENLISNQYSQKRFSKKGLLNIKVIENFAKQAIETYEIKCSGSGTKIEMLSGGNMQKVVVARESSKEPKVLIAEQPTRGVDVGAAHIIHEKLLTLRNQGGAVLLVSADLGEVMKVSDQLIVMYEGKIVAYFEDVAQVTEEELGLCMLGVHKHGEEQIRRAIHE